MHRKLWPGPVALVFEVPEKHGAKVAAAWNLPESDLYDGDRITLRCPDHPDGDRTSSRPAAGPSRRCGRWRISRPTGRRSPGNWKGRWTWCWTPARRAIPSRPRSFRVEPRQLRGGSARHFRRADHRAAAADDDPVCMQREHLPHRPMAEAMARRVLADRLKITEDELEKKGITGGVGGRDGACPVAGDARRRRCRAGDGRGPFEAPLPHPHGRLIHQADQIYTMGQSHARR